MRFGSSQHKIVEPIRPTRNPALPSPTKVVRTEKAPGSLVFSFGKWFVVQPDGELVEKVD